MKELIKLTKKLDLESVKKLVRSYLEYDKIDKDGNTVLIKTTRKHQSTLNRKKTEKKVIRLIELGCDLDKQNKFGQTALMVACGDICSSQDIAWKLIEAGCDINICNKDGVNVLHDCNEDIAVCLIDKGCDMNRQDRSGETVLMNHCYYQREKAIYKLIEAGCNMDLKDENGKTYLDHLNESYDTYYINKNMSEMKKIVKKAMIARNERIKLLLILVRYVKKNLDKIDKRNMKYVPRVVRNLIYKKN